MTFNCTTYNPNYKACLTPLAQSYPYCNTSLPIDARLDNLLSLLNLTEKVALISAQPSLGNTCRCHTSGISRIGLPEFMWLVEANSGIAAMCLAPGKCATTFPGPLGMGASFNRTLWRLKGSVSHTVKSISRIFT